MNTNEPIPNTDKPAEINPNNIPKEFPGKPYKDNNSPDNPNLPVTPQEIPSLPESEVPPPQSKKIN